MDHPVAVLSQRLSENPLFFFEKQLYEIFIIFSSHYLRFLLCIFCWEKKKNGRDSLRTKWPFRSLDFLGDYQYNPIKRLLQKFENHSVGKVFIWKTTSEASYVYFQDRNTVFEFSRNIQIFRRLLFLLSIWDIFGGKIQTILRPFRHKTVVKCCIIWRLILPMKEYERLFAQNNENGVSQFWHFGHDKHKGPVSGHTILFNKTVTEGGETKVQRRFCFDV